MNKKKLANLGVRESPALRKELLELDFVENNLAKEEMLWGSWMGFYQKLLWCFWKLLQKKKNEILRFYKCFQNSGFDIKNTSQN